MSQVNAVTIIADNLQSANITTSNVVTLTVVANQVTITTGNITANSTVLKLDNTTSPIYNTSINTTAISTAAINLDSVQYTSIAPSYPAQPLTDYQVFTNPAADNKWYKPSWAESNDVVTIMMWGGGGGSSGQVAQAGGGGGACVIAQVLVSQCNSVCNVVVGAGGADSGGGSNADPGGNSQFFTNSSFSITAYGGGGGFANTLSIASGSGGGWFAGGVTGGQNGAAGGAPLGGTSASPDSTFGGGYGANTGLSAASVGGASVYGGGGGGTGAGAGGSSIYGGGGGSGTGVPGTSVFGGRGGNTSVSARTPGGGGGGSNPGANGEVRITTTKSAIGGASTPTYSIAANKTSLYEGESTVFTVTTFNVANGTTLYYTLNNSSTATAADFSTAVNGSIVINGGSNTFTLTANTNGDAAESFFMDLRTGSSTGTIVANSSTINVGVIQAVYNGYTFIGDDNLTTSTWSSAPISTADTNRRVIVVIYQRQADDALNNTTASAVTIGGVSATVLEYRGDDTRGHVDIWGATVPTGTTADVAVTWRYPTGDAKTLATYSLYGANLTPYSTANNRVATTTVSANVNVVAGGFVIAAAGADSPGGSFSTFTAGVDTNSPISTIGSSGSPGWGSKSITSTQTNYTVTANSTAGGDLLLAVTSFQPG